MKRGDENEEGLPFCTTAPSAEHARAGAEDEPCDDFRAIEPSESEITLRKGDALIVVDMQNDFLPGGSLAVKGGDEVLSPLNQYIAAAEKQGLPVFATRDWHPPDHSSFKEQGGPWPPHCVVGSRGAEFASELRVPESGVVISKGATIEKDAYSGFEGTNLDERLRSAGIRRVLIGGLATDYCVLNTVKDALNQGYEVLLLEDAIAAVNVNPEDGKDAIDEMISLGAVPIRIERILR
jgi:nicotinamidase/pyrazinamidase